MAHRLVKQAVAAYVPAVEEVLAVPARTVVVYERRSVLKWTSEYKLKYYNYRYENGYVSIPAYVFVGKPYYAEEIVPVYTTYPAIPAVAGRDAQTITDSQIGWNGGAQSVVVLGGDFVTQATVSSEVLGVLVGVQRAGGTSGSVNEISHGIQIASRRASVIESGASKVGAALPNGDVLIQIQRIGRKITYRAGPLSFTSDVESVGPVTMASVIYAGGEYVDNPSFADLVLTRSSGNWAWGDGSGVYALSAASSWAWGSYASVNDGQASMSVEISMRAADEEISGAVMVMGEPSISQFKGFTDVDTAVGTMAIPMVMQASGIGIEVGSAFMSFGASMRAADYDYGESNMEIDDIQVYGYSDELPDGYGGSDEAIFASDFYIVDPVAYASIVESLTLRSGFDALLTMEANLADHLMLMDDTAIGLVISALLENRIGIADASVRSSRDVFEYINSITGLSGLYDFTGNTYSTNLVTGAVSRYAGFDFKGFCRVGMKTYGYRSDGLYLIGGDTDAGAFIGARADFGADDFGTAQGKRVGNVFMGLTTDGQVYVRTIEDDHQEMVYRAYQRKGEYRADMQRGRASRFWRMRLEVVEGNFAELDNVEWVLTQTGRRSN
ncbi:hypothetical protein [Pseudomonas syringae]|uniref:hypothetical protein n=1 Tax=Pseudomonas syringae TaxID=317 RepID=UPI001F0D1CE3|nr:hypothetical protein [Pseudomonas syringae]MCH5583110.1 hypothetical protein [Pseudomonas syringae pv. syringae]MCH5592791.1 hypothetical protein [Pseudomonas syringae pv. syringae]MDF5791042.1 hypothetical protein [Pseudomonas syringae pv. syringae]